MTNGCVCTDSEGGRRLAANLGIPTMDDPDYIFKGGKDTFIINWGRKKTFGLQERTCKILNEPKRIRVVTNRQRWSKGVRDFIKVPKISRTRDEVASWLEEGAVVVHDLRCVEEPGLLVEGREYIEYIPKKLEYKFHFGGGMLLCIRQKGCSENNFGSFDHRILNSGSGHFWYDVTKQPSNRVCAIGRTAFDLSGLDFGSVTVLWSKFNNEATVLKVDCTPSFKQEEKLLSIYCTYFKNSLKIMGGDRHRAMGMVNIEDSYINVRGGGPADRVHMKRVAPKDLEFMRVEWNKQIDAKKPDRIIKVKVGPVENDDF